MLSWDIMPGLHNCCWAAVLTEHLAKVAARIQCSQTLALLLCAALVLHSPTATGATHDAASKIATYAIIPRFKCLIQLRMAGLQRSSVCLPTRPNMHPGALFAQIHSTAIYNVYLVL